MNSIFVVTQCLHDYDGGSDFPIFATFSEDRATAKVSEMEARLAVKVAMHATINEYMKIWEASNPRPGPSSKMTFAEWAAERYEILKSFTETFSEQEQEDYVRLDSDMVWDIESVPFEE